MKTEHQFKPGERFKIGQHVLLPAVVVGFDENGYSFRATDKTEEVLPAPREGEYRLTVEEIIEMASFAEEYAVENATGRTYWSVYTQAVEQWLANRKENAPMETGRADELKEETYLYTRLELFNMINDVIDVYNEWRDIDRMRGSCWDYCKDCTELINEYLNDELKWKAKS